MNTLDHYNKEHAAIKSGLPGQQLGWLSDSRDKALGIFNTLGFPTPRQEAWKYTNTRPIEKHPFHLTRTVKQGIDASILNQYLPTDMACHLIVFVNGHYCRELSGPDTLPNGLSIKNLDMALTDDADEIQNHLGKIADPNRNAFTAMNTAFMHDGAVIKLAKDTQVVLPVHLMFLSTRSEQETTTQSRILVLAEKNARAGIIEHYVSVDDAAVYFNNITTEMRLAAHASIEHYKIQQESNKAFHIATLHVDQARDSTFTSHSISLGAQIARNDINVWMGDEGADCNLYGLYITNGRQHTDFHTRIDHARPHCSSNEFYKGILGGYSRAVFNGQVHIHPDAQKSDARQANNNLLLSGNAEVDAKPQLEIYADDVTASHGATIGQLDDDMIFYLRSRGIDYHTAHALLVYGFAHDIVEKISLPPLQEHLEKLLTTHIPDAGHLNSPVKST